MRNKKYFLSLFAAIILIATGYGLDHALPYAPGQTLDPSCNPGDANCTVRGVIIDNGTVAGVNATSSTVSFNIQGSGTLNPFNIASSTGTSLMTILANGTIGVGTTTPSTTFAIQGTAGASDLLDIASSTGSSVLHVTAAGSVGINTKTPSETLEIDNTTDYGGILLKTPTSGIHQYIAVQQGEGYPLQIFTSYTNGVPNTEFYSGGNGTMRMSTNRIAINGAVTATSTAPIFGVFSISNSYVPTTAVVAQFTQSGSGDILQAISSGTVRFDVTSSGTVGVGTSTPVADFQVTNASANATSTMEIGKSGQTKGTCLKIYDSAGTAWYVTVSTGGTLSASASTCKSGF